MDMIKVCPVCGKRFETLKKRQRTCSTDCSHIWMSSSSIRTNKERPITPTTYLLVELYWREDGYNARQIARELRRDVDVIEEILDNIKHGKHY